MNRLIALGVLASLAVLPRVAAGSPIGYLQTNLTSDVPGLAANTDPNLKNPWGMSFTPTSPFWISDQATGVATLYNGAGVPQSLVVSVPSSNTPPAGPTGLVFAGSQNFTMQSGGRATFVFATLGGTIDAWPPNGTVTSAETEFTASDHAVYTGLALVGQSLYAADNRNGKIDVFNSSFQKTTLAGTFTDPTLPAGFTPYNIQNIGGLLYVEYEGQTVLGGFIDVFNPDGTFVRRFSSDPVLDQPWGIVLAPSGFGDFANDVLVGNFGNGEINAFDPVSGIFQGVLSDPAGNPIVDRGLWTLAFRAPGSGFDSNTLFFTAGINGEQDGLFGQLQVAAPTSSDVPEPASLLLLGTGVLATARRLRRRQTNAQN